MQYIASKDAAEDDGADKAEIGARIKDSCHFEVGDDFFRQLAKSERHAIAANPRAVSLPTRKVVKALWQGQQPFCIASNNRFDLIKHLLAHTGMMRFFEPAHIFTSAQVAQGKPAPDLFLFAAAQMGYPPTSCIVVEDSIPGLQAAKAAKMDAITFLGTPYAQRAAT